MKNFFFKKLFLQPLCTHTTYKISACPKSGVSLLLKEIISLHNLIKWRWDELGVGKKGTKQNPLLTLCFQCFLIHETYSSHMSRDTNSENQKIREHVKCIKGGGL